MEMLLAGDSPYLEILRQQLARSSISSREHTGVGCFTNFQIPSELPRLPESRQMTIGDVSAKAQGLQNGIGFVLFINAGSLDFLESFTFDEPWPEKIEHFQLSYVVERSNGNGESSFSKVRQFNFGLKDLRASG